MDTSEDTNSNQENSNQENNKTSEKNRNGRIGPSDVRIEEKYCFGTTTINNETLEISSTSNFSSFRANTCLYDGKWMYEVILLSDGLQQIGWSPLSWSFTDEMGVGDFIDSYAYDGKRKKKWNIKDENYGSDWTRGDVIGVALDLTNATISFYRNGISLGVAYQNIRTKVHGLAYFPALSVSHGESCILNFGRRQFEHPIEGYEPIDQRRRSLSSQVAQFKYSVDCLASLLEEVSKNNIKKDSQEEVLIFACLFEKIAPLLSLEYNVTAHFVPLIEKLCENNKIDHLASLFKYSENYLEVFFLFIFYFYFLFLNYLRNLNLMIFGTEFGFVSLSNVR